MGSDPISFQEGFQVRDGLRLVVEERIRILRIPKLIAVLGTERRRIDLTALREEAAAHTLVAVPRTGLLPRTAVHKLRERLVDHLVLRRKIVVVLEIREEELSLALEKLHIELDRTALGVQRPENRP